MYFCPPSSQQRTSSSSSSPTRKSNFDNNFNNSRRKASSQTLQVFAAEASSGFKTLLDPPSSIYFNSGKQALHSFHEMMSSPGIDPQSVTLSIAEAPIAEPALRWPYAYSQQTLNRRSVDHHLSVYSQDSLDSLFGGKRTNSVDDEHPRRFDVDVNVTGDVISTLASSTLGPTNNSSSFIVEKCYDAGGCSDNHCGTDDNTGGLSNSNGTDAAGNNRKPCIKKLRSTSKATLAIRGGISDIIDSPRKNQPLSKQTKEKVIITCQLRMIFDFLVCIFC
jgi:hypothetical protein